MRQRLSPPLLFASGVVLAGALAVALVAASIQAALIALVMGAAAVLAAATYERSSDTVAATHDDAGAALDDILDAIVAPVLLARDQRVVRANVAARRLLGSHILGEDIRTAIRNPAATQRLASSTPDPAPIELVGLGTSDQRWEMRVAVGRDETRIVHLVDQSGSYAAERMRVDFVANASHELRTPLASILGYVETLRDEAGDDPAIRKRFLQIMFDEARRMQRLVDDLISLSRIEAEKYRPPARAVDLVALIADVRDELANDHGARGGDIALVLDPAAPTVAGDSSQLSQVLHNIIGNAMKYGRAGTPITVTLDSEGEQARLVVRDEGDGIPPEHLPRLTERFYRVDAGRSRALGGTGLGLAIVKHIVERHRGRLDIASSAGSGTRVTVTLPAAAVIKP